MQREKRVQEMLTLCEQAGFRREKRIETYLPQAQGVQQAFKATKRFIGRLQEYATARDRNASQEISSAHLPDCWLVLVGPVGVGKTHLLMSLGNAALERDILTVFSTVPDLLDSVRQTYDPQRQVSYDEFFEKLKKSELLLLDDLGTETITSWATEKLFQLLNYRYNMRLPTAITLNNQAWRYLDERLHSRLSDTHLVEVIQMDGAQDYLHRKEADKM